MSSDKVRPPACIGCYDGDPTRLRRQIEALFTSPVGPGLPIDKRPDGQLGAALIPHMDYARGGITEAWGFKEVYERTDASLFLIVGTSHYSGHRFTLTRQHFRTPLGTVPTDATAVDRIVRYYGPGLFDDERTHDREHSIELEVVFLQYLYEGKRSIRIVPLLVGPFNDCVEDRAAPTTRADVARMVEALRRVVAEANEPVCTIISGDLAHIGPKFRDPRPVDDARLKHSRERDRLILRQTEDADAAGFFQTIAEEGDRRRICGLGPTYTVLEALRPTRGQVLHYDQYVHPRGHESVSFASVGFYR